MVLKNKPNLMLKMVKSMNKRYVKSRRCLIFWTLFIGIGAVAGSLMMFIDPSGKFVGMDGMLPFFQVLPFAEVLFQNLLFSGIMLLIVNGLTNIISAVLLLKNKKVGIYLGMIFGITLMLWIVIQFVVFPANFMSTTYFIFGFCQFLTGYICLVGYNQSQFGFNSTDYKNIGTNNSKLVIFFSRMGYTKKIAYEEADKIGADILEIKTTEKIDGNLGFWWCGRFGMHRWGMRLEEIDVDLTKYDNITICTPTWVFALSSPIREFCKIYNGKIKNVNYIVTHFMNCRFNNIAEEMDNLLGVKHNGFKSVCVRFGKGREVI